VGGQAHAVTPRRGRPPTISDGQLVEAARRLGPDAVDLQSVGEALGVARTSLYYHVRNTDELGRKVLEHIVDDASATDWLPPPDAPWDSCLRAYAVEFRRVLVLAAPWLRFAGQSSLYTRRRLESVDQLMGRLVDAGFTIDDASAAMTFVSLLVQASVSAEDDLDTVRAHVAGVGPDELTWIRRGLVALNAADADRRFEQHLDRAIAGIRAQHESGQP